MAKIFFTQEGQTPEHVFFAGNLFASGVAHHFASFERKFFPDLPVIGFCTNLTDYSNCRYVFVKIESDEVSQEFPESGYYLILNLEPATAKDMLDAASN